jgi:hypothetical protein
MSAATVQPSLICQLVDNHREINRLIDAYPSCLRAVSYQVDRLLVDAESIADFYLNR